MFGYVGCVSLVTPLQRLVLSAVVQVDSARYASLDLSVTNPPIFVLVATLLRYLLWRGS